MRCYICDAQDDNISVDPKDGKFRPCFICQSVITESLMERSTVNEDDFLVDEDFDNA